MGPQPSINPSTNQHQYRLPGAGRDPFSSLRQRCAESTLIACPGRALAYKMRELKILALYHRDKADLRARLDIRNFHDAVLANGGATLPVLEAQIEAYIKLHKTQ